MIRKLAKVTEAEIGDVYNGMLGLRVSFEVEEGYHQGLGGYMVEAALIVRFVRAIGADSLGGCVGRSCWLLYEADSLNEPIAGVEPLHKKDGRPFVIKDWQAWLKRRMPGVSYRELETGENPRAKQ